MVEQLNAERDRAEEWRALAMSAVSMFDAVDRNVHPSHMSSINALRRRRATMVAKEIDRGALDARSVTTAELRERVIALRDVDHRDNPSTSVLVANLFEAIVSYIETNEQKRT